MKVEVRIQKGKIHAIRVLDIRGAARFYQAAVDSLPDRIRIKNNLDVDAVSGATLSSNSLKDAVQAALEKAK